MIFTDFIICALAASAIVDLWFNGSIFADQRKLVEARGDWCDDKDSANNADDMELPPNSEEVDTWVNKCPCLLAQLLSCSHCLSHHTPFWVFTWYYGVALLPVLLTEALRLPIYTLAAARLMNLVTTISGKPYQDLFNDE